MYVNTIIATERMIANHTMVNEGLKECACHYTTTQFLNFAMQPRLRTDLPLVAIQEKYRLAYSLIVHGEEWLTEFVANLQANGVSEINRRAIKKTIKDEAKRTIEDAAEYMTVHDGLSLKDQRTADKLNAMLTQLDKTKTRLIEQGEDEEVVEEAILAVLRRKISQD